MSPRGTATPWFLRAQDLLADGEWHDGRTILLEAGKTITPGFAHRMTERNRRADGPPERVKQLPVPRQIEQGKRYTLTEMVRMKVKSGTWETDPPYPMGHGLFRVDKPWRLRLLRGTAFVHVPDVAERYGVSGHAVRTLIREHGLPAENIGTKSRALLRIDTNDLPLYEKAIEEWVATKGRRLADKQRRGANAKVSSNIAKYLAEEVGPSTDSPMKRVRRLVEDLARLRHEYAALNVENARLRHELEIRRGKPM